MSILKSPDRPATFLHRWMGIEDKHPPITDAEYALYRRFTDSIAYAPRDLAEAVRYPRKVNRMTREAVRQLVTDTGFSALLDRLERAKAESIAAEERREREKQAEEARAELRRQQEKLADIDRYHDNQLNEVGLKVGEFQHLMGRSSIDEATLRMEQESQSDATRNRRTLNTNLAAQTGGLTAVVAGAAASWQNNSRDMSGARRLAASMAEFVIKRSLVSMTDAERATLRMADVLAALGHLQRSDHLRIAAPIIWNGGDCAYDFDPSMEFRQRSAMLEVFKQLMATSIGTSAGAREFLNQAVRSALSETEGLPQAQRDIVERYLFTGNRWMSEAEGQRALARGDLSASALRIGGFRGGSGELLYDLRESLITIAPSGTGKSQSHVLRNLLYLKAPAVVLDIKGEMSDASRHWREQEVGKTFVFSPREPESSFHYNPLDDIRLDPELAWEDARTVADLIFKPSAATRDDAYFEGRARDLLTTALLDVALAQKGAKRTMASVLELLYTSDDEEVIAWCNRLEKRKSPQLKLQASALRGMPVKQRESLLDTARRHVEVWQSPNILKITKNTTFDPADIRALNATIYLKVTLEDVERYASVLRVLVGQLLLKLYRTQPESDAPVVTFFLDELPRLGRLDVIEQSLDMGRGYGVRLWLFCQNLGQLQTAYPNAQGMLSNCAIRCFMNPDEDAARWLSENLSTRHGLLDGTRKPLVESHQLTGPEFANQVVVFSRGQLPARLDKKPAYADPVCRSRMDTPTLPAAAVPEAAKNPNEETPAAPPAPEAIDVPAAPLDWTEVRNAAPASLFAPPAPVVWVFPKWPVFAAAVAAVLVIAGLGYWLVLQDSELASLRAANELAIGSAETAEQARQSLEREKASWLESVRNSELARAKVREEADRLRNLLETEKKDHGVTRDRLTVVQRDLEAEKARAAARVLPPTPTPPSAPTPAPSPPAEVQPQPVPQVQASAPPSPPVQRSPFPDVARPTLPGNTTVPPTADQKPVALNDCDALAANPNDPRRVGAGVRYPDLKRNVTAALEACEKAVASNPNELRFHYQKARALYAANDMRARGMFHQLMTAGYPSAFDNAAQYFVREGRLDQAEKLWRRGVQLQDPDAMVSLADAIRAGTIRAAAPAEDLVLYQAAARIGHQGAKNVVDEMRAAGNLILDTGTQGLRAIER